MFSEQVEKCKPLTRCLCIYLGRKKICFRNFECSVFMHENDAELMHEARFSLLWASLLEVEFSWGAVCSRLLTWGAMFIAITHCAYQLSTTENSSIFMATYTIRLLMWRTMDNCWVIWPRQRFPMTPLTCQYKWLQKMCPVGAGHRAFRISMMKNVNEFKTSMGRISLYLHLVLPYSYRVNHNAGLGDMNQLVPGG